MGDSMKLNRGWFPLMNWYSIIRLLISNIASGKSIFEIRNRILYFCKYIPPPYNNFYHLPAAHHQVLHLRLCHFRRAAVHGRAGMFPACATPALVIITIFHNYYRPAPTVGAIFESRHNFFFFSITITTPIGSSSRTSSTRQTVTLSLPFPLRAHWGVPLWATAEWNHLIIEK